MKVIILRNELAHFYLPWLLVFMFVIELMKGTVVFVFNVSLVNIILVDVIIIVTVVNFSLLLIVVLVSLIVVHITLVFRVVSGVFFVVNEVK